MVAKTLEGAYKVLEQKPLSTEEDFRTKYVPRASPIDELEINIKLGKKSAKYLFVGHRGSGKSTELFRLVTRLKDHFVVHFFVTDALDINDLKYQDLLLSLLLMLYERAAKEGIEIDKRILEDINKFLIEITKTEDRTKRIGLEFGLPILFKIKTEHETRESIREALEFRVTDLIERVNNLILEIKDKTGRDILIVIDDLDKISREEDAKELFYSNASILVQPDCKIVYTFPISMVHSIDFQQIRQFFDDTPSLLNIKVRNRDSEVIQEGIEFFKNVLASRMDLGLIEEDALNLAIDKSGGMLSEFIRILRGSSVVAVKEGVNKITKANVNEIVSRLRDSFDRILTKEHLDKLVEVHDFKEAKDGRIVQELFHSLSIFEYVNERRWCDVNPLILPLVEEWKERRKKS